MIVQCARCTCPLDANSSSGTVTCTYCGTSQPVASLQVLRSETPPGWQPPPFWAPPPNIQAQLGGQAAAPFGMPTGQPYGMPYGMQPGGAMRSSGGGGAGCAVAIGAVLVVALAGGGVFFAAFGSHFRSLNRNAPPTLGSFAPDPNQPTAELSRVGTANGGIDAHSLQTNCRGYISSAPDLVIHANDLRMYSITTSATEDLTMVVGGPNNTFFCDDDSGQGMNPLIHMALPVGTYPVWIGTYRRNVRASYTLQVEAMSPGLAATNALDPTVAGGGMGAFVPDALGTIDVASAPSTTTRPGMNAGGPNDAHTMGQSCRGWVGVEPTATIQVGSHVALEVKTIAHDDLTMVVQAPDGTTSCDDDSGGSLQPRVALDAQPGAYRVWVGEYSQSAHGPYALMVSATIPGSAAGPGTRHRNK